MKPTIILSYYAYWSETHVLEGVPCILEAQSGAYWQRRTSPGAEQSGITVPSNIKYYLQEFVQQDNVILSFSRSET